MIPLHKRTIRLSGLIDPDGNLKVDLPKDLPPGPVQLDITMSEPHNTGTSLIENQLEILRVRLEANGHPGIRLPDPNLPPAALTDAQLLEIGKLPPGVRPSHELIDEDRQDRV